MAGHSTSKLVVYAALTANLLIALTKLGAAWWTGSSAMLSESVHSFVDTGNQALLLYGIHRATKPPDESHPLGYGRELYFWSFIVALLIGEPASLRTRELIVATAQETAGVERANLLFTVHLSPHQIVAALSLQFSDALTTPELEDKVRDVERAIREAAPDVSSVFIRPQQLAAAPAG
jgi:divalent metal cation (Fe/Co/Zn/Cd) transporter